VPALCPKVDAFTPDSGVYGAQMPASTCTQIDNPLPIAKKPLILRREEEIRSAQAPCSAQRGTASVVKNLALSFCLATRPVPSGAADRGTILADHLSPAFRPAFPL
jgi:hypothetical protein